MFEEEKNSLLAVPAIAFSNLKTFDVKVDKYATAIGTKEFLSVLLLGKEHPSEELHSVIELAVEQQIDCFAGVKYLLLYLQEPPNQAS